MSDLIDVLSGAGLRTGKVLAPAEIHRLRKVHRAVRLYLLNPRHQVFPQRRGSNVDHAPGRLGISVAGRVGAGESSSDAVGREVEEELGLSTSRLEIRFLFSYFQEVIPDKAYIDRQFNDVYVTRAAVEPGTLRLDRSEVSGVEFVPFESFLGTAPDEDSAFTSVYANECRDLAYLLDDPRAEA